MTGLLYILHSLLESPGLETSGTVDGMRIVPVELRIFLPILFFTVPGRSRVVVVVVRPGKPGILGIPSRCIPHDRGSIVEGRLYDNRSRRCSLTRMISAICSSNIQRMVMLSGSI